MEYVETSSLGIGIIQRATKSTRILYTERGAAVVSTITSVNIDLRHQYLPLSRRRSPGRNVPSGEERGERDVFEGYNFPGARLFTNRAILH